MNRFIRKTTYLAATLICMCILLSTADAQQKGWTITADKITPDNYYGATLANGMIGIVPSAEPMKMKEIILNGTFDAYGRGRVPNILKTFDFLNLNMEVDGIWLGKNEMTNYRQSLDMKNAILTSSFDHENKVQVTEKTMALRHLPHTALIQVEVKAKKDATILVYVNLSSPDILRDVQNSFQLIDRPHALIPLMTSIGKSPSGKHTLAATNTIMFEEPRESAPEIVYEEWDYNAHRMKFSKKLRAGETYTFSIAGSTISSTHINDPLNESERMTIYAALEKSARLIQRHQQDWSSLWESDIVIEGDDEMQTAIRLGLYHLYSFARKGTSYSLSPMGLSGLGYNGHVFWDTEIWMFPVFVQLQPEMAKSLLEYRFQRLEEARQNALRHGYDGAMFPWESDHEGQESTPVWALTGPFQHHITADVGFAFWKYYQVTKDKAWLKSRGFPVLKEVASFFVSRAEKGERNEYHIRNVVAADEFAENVDDNAFTNGAAKEVLAYATEAAKILQEIPDPRWKEVSDGLVILRFPDGVTKEHAQYNGETIKQCDVNLLAYPLNIIQDPKQIARDLEYYQPRLHRYGPAMSHSILSLLQARAGNPDEAYKILSEAFKRNQLPPFAVLAETWGGTNPYFATGAGGFIQTVLNGFGGLSISNAGITKSNVKLPSNWKSLTLKGVGVEKKTYVIRN
jgi:protein-glucosylgalactosylhydroxylysine glucosidase